LATWHWPDLLLIVTQRDDHTNRSVEVVVDVNAGQRNRLTHFDQTVGMHPWLAQKRRLGAGRTASLSATQFLIRNPVPLQFARPSSAKIERSAGPRRGWGR